MWKRTWTRYFGALFIAACFFSFWPSAGGCSATYTISKAELTTLETHLSELEHNNNALSNILNELTQELDTSKTELTQLKEALKTANAALTKSKQDLAALKAESQAAQKSLKTANAELQIALKSLDESEHAHRKRENQLEKQRLLWQIVSVILCGVAVGT